jgi:hypothetical protein
LLEAVMINTVDVVHDAIEGEVVVVNLKNGHYYSMTDSAAAIWGGLVDGLDVPGLVAHLQTCYEGDAETMRAAVVEFMSVLMGEGLVVSGGPSTDAPPPRAPSSAAPARRGFQVPTLAKHIDMEGLLILDPVHDVSADGWPQAKV